jgi:hypothetical protein
VKELSTGGVVPGSQLRLTLEANLIVGANLASDEPGIIKRLVKLNTGLVYRQQKYNILREETEGFSHLIAVLNSIPTDPHLAASSITQVLSVIGHFDLDPNRVLDVILDVYEHQTWNESFIPLIRHFRKTSLAPIVGLKFLNHQSTSSAASTAEVSTESADLSKKENADPAPANLFALAAVLLAHKLVDLSDLLPYLHPSIEETVADWNNFETKQRKDIQSFGVVSLSGTASPAPSLKQSVSTASLSSLNTGASVKPPPPSTPMPSNATASSTSGRPPAPPMPPPPAAGSKGAESKVRC